MRNIVKVKIEHQKGVFALIFLALVFASMGIFARYLSADFLVLQQVYLRVLAAFFLGLIFFRKDLEFSKLKKIKWHSNLLNNKEITIIIFLLSFFMLFITSLVKGDGLPVTGWHMGSFFVILVAGLFNVMNLYLMNYGFQKVEAILASNILTLESAFAVILGFLFYREVPIVKELIGGIVIILSVIGMNKVEAKD